VKLQPEFNNSGAGGGNRTLFLSLENSYTSRCTTPATGVIITDNTSLIKSAYSNKTHRLAGAFFD
jgi:hypothetical protein